MIVATAALERAALLLSKLLDETAPADARAVTAADLDDALGNPDLAPALRDHVARAKPKGVDFLGARAAAATAARTLSLLDDIVCDRASTLEDVTNPRHAEDGLGLEAE